MNSAPEELDDQTKALIEKLRPEPQRDAGAAANGRSKFLAEARDYRAAASAAADWRRIGRKENTMRLARIPIFLLLIALVGVLLVGKLMFPKYYLMSESSAGPIPSIISRIFPSIDSSLISVGPSEAQQQMPHSSDQYSHFGPTPAPRSTGGAVAPVPPAQQQQPYGQPTVSSAFVLPQSPSFSNQMVIKNGDIQLLVKDTDRALDGVSQIVTDMRGYVLSSRVWYQDYYGSNHKFATLTIGVPADQFENALQRLRSLAVRVLDENASGQDVTEQYVDLQSQLSNLEATRDRIRSFLDQATTVDEALQVNQRLSEVEMQIEQIKGQMNYLSNRSAFSTITINLLPDVPEIEATPTATPVAGLGPWDAGETTRQATDTLVSAYRLIANFLIWFVVVIVPVLGPPVVLVWLVMWLLRRRGRTGAKGQGV